MRRITSTSLALALSLSIGGVALAQATQTSAGAGTTSSAAPAPAATPATVTEVSVVIPLLLDSSGQPVGVGAPSPDPIELQLNKQKVHWTLDTTNDAEVVVKMHGASPAPFKHSPTHPNNKKKEMVSEVPTDASTVGKSYKYKITVTLAGGHKLPTLDPIIKITPEPPPPTAPAK